MAGAGTALNLRATVCQNDELGSVHFGLRTDKPCNPHRYSLIIAKRSYPVTCGCGRLSLPASVPFPHAILVHHLSLLYRDHTASCQSHDSAVDNSKGRTSARTPGFPPIGSISLIRQPAIELAIMWGSDVQKPAIGGPCAKLPLCTGTGTGTGTRYMCHGTRGHKRQAEKPSRTRTWRRTDGQRQVSE